MTHTKEPWRAEDCDVVAFVDQFPTAISHCFNDASIGSNTAEANARRIVACVNACAGIPTEHIEHCSNRPGSLFVVPNDAQQAISQRDELLAALKDCVLSLRIIERNTGCSYDSSLKGSEIIAKAEGAK